MLAEKTVSSWEVGYSEPKMGMVAKMAKIFGVNNSDIVDVVDSTAAEHSSSYGSSKGALIKVLGTVPAGIPIEAVEDVIDFEEIDAKLASTGIFFGLIIKGDSMSPRITDGDTVIVKQQDDVDNGDVAIVIVNGQDATCKKVMKSEAGLMLMPLNPSYEPKLYSPKEAKNTPVKIVGKVVELRRKF